VSPKKKLKRASFEKRLGGLHALECRGVGTRGKKYKVEISCERRVKKNQEGAGCSLKGTAKCKRVWGTRVVGWGNKELI